MGRVNKKKLAEYNTESENGDSKAVGSDTDKNKQNVSTFDSSDDDTNEPANASSSNNVNQRKKSYTDDSDVEHEQQNAPKKAAKKRKAAAEENVQSDENDEYANDSDDQPLNGKQSGGTSSAAKKARIAKKVKAVATTGSNKNANSKNSKSIKKSKKTRVSGDEKEETDDENTDDDANDQDNESNNDAQTDEYEVAAIVGHKVLSGINHYLIRWKGYTKEDDTWEPEHTLSCPDLIDDYNKKNGKTSKSAKPINKALSTKANTQLKSSGRNSSSAGSGNDDNTGNAAINLKVSESDKEDPDQEWEVEKIIDCAQDEDGKRIFRIRWAGFSPKHDSWEPEENLSCGDLIAKFTKKLNSNKPSGAKLRKDPKKTRRLLNESSSRSNTQSKIGRTSKRTSTKNRVFYGEE